MPIRTLLRFHCNPILICIAVFFFSTCVILSLGQYPAKWPFSPHRKQLSGALVTTGCTRASLFSLAKHLLLEWPTFPQEPHPGRFLLYLPRRRHRSDVSQILLDQGVDPTSLLRRGKGEETVIRCNSHRLQNSKQYLHKGKRLVGTTAAAGLA